MNGTTVIEEVEAECIRQTEVEGYTAEHDDTVNDNGDLALAYSPLLKSFTNELHRDCQVTGDTTITTTVTKEAPPPVKKTHQKEAPTS